MKAKLLCCLCLIGMMSNGQVTSRNLLSGRYTATNLQTALIPKSTWKPYPQTAAGWKAILNDSLISSIIKSAEGDLKYNFEPISATVSLDFVRSGDRERHGKISYGKRNALTNLIIAESIEDKGRFMEAIMNGIWSICEESFWGVPAHIGHTGLPDVEHPVVELFGAETASVMAIADYFVGAKLDKINPLIRKRIYFETNRRLFVPMMTESDNYGWMSKTHPVNNWNPWIMSNWMMSILLLEKDEKRRSEMLYASMKGLDRYLNGLGEDGGCDEGPSYWFAAGGSVYDCLELLQQSTDGKIQIFDQPLIQKMASYVYKAHISGYYFTNFADADPVLKPDGLMLYRFGKAIQDERLTEFGKWAHQNFPNTSVSGYQRMRRIENLMTANLIEKNNHYTPVNDAWVSDIQVMTARASNGIYLATHGGHNAESHNHNDVGDFIIYADGQPMIVDAGRGNYTARTFSSHRYELWFTQSNYHNLPIINGIGQKEGREYEAKDVKSVINEKEAGLQMDIAGAYPKEAGIKTWKRNITLNRIKNTVTVADDFNLENKPSSLDQVFMTICDQDLSLPGKILLKGDNQVTLQISYDPQKWTVTTEKTSTDGMEYSSFKTKWNGKLVTRILLHAKAPEAKGKHQFLIEKLQ